MTEPLRLTIAELVEIRAALKARQSLLRTSARRATTAGTPVAAALDTSWADACESALDKLDPGAGYEAELTFVESNPGEPQQGDVVTVGGWSAFTFVGGPTITFDQGRAVPEMLVFLEVGAKQFRFYEAQHRAKGTDEADAKAEVNRKLAERFEAVLAKANGEKTDAR